MAKKEVKRFLFNCEWNDTLSKLPDTSYLNVVKAVIGYVNDGTVPSLDVAESIAFDFIRKEIDWNGDKYKEISKRRSKAGKKGGGNPNFKKGQPNPYYEDKQKINKDKQALTKINYNDNDNDNDNELSNDNIKENVLTDIKEKTDAENKEKPKRVIFVKPTIAQVKERMQEMGYTGFSAEAFWNFYESKGWMVGSNPMKNWKAALVTWNSQHRQRGRGDQTHDRMHYEGEHNPHAYDEAEEIAKWQTENEL